MFSNQMHVNCTNINFVQTQLNKSFVCIPLSDEPVLILASKANCSKPNLIKGIGIIENKLCVVTHTAKQYG
jgi:hypothetical protein